MGFRVTDVLNSSIWHIHFLCKILSHMFKMLLFLKGGWVDKHNVKNYIHSTFSKTVFSSSCSCFEYESTEHLHVKRDLEMCIYLIVVMRLIYCGRDRCKQILSVYWLICCLLLSPDYWHWWEQPGARRLHRKGATDRDVVATSGGRWRSWGSVQNMYRPLG